MKKLLFIILCCLTLTGCSFFNETTTKREPTAIDEYNVYEAQSAMIKVAEEASKACIGVLNVTNSNERGTGSGVIFHSAELPNGYTKYFAITNYHVIEDYKYLKVYLGKNNYGDIYVAADYTNIGSEADDIAIITFSYKKELGIAKLGLDDNIVKGEFVVAIGCPLGLSLFNTVTTGVVSNIDDDQVQHDAAINPGNSGGGLFNLKGDLIGINSSKYTSTGTTSVEGIGFAIGLSVVNKYVQNCTNNTPIESNVKLGVSVIEYNTFINNTSEEELINVPSNLQGGLVVYEVVSGGNAYVGGLQKYDVIVKYNDIDINVRKDMSGALANTVIGDKVKITVYRNNTLMELEIEMK